MDRRRQHARSPRGLIDVRSKVPHEHACDASILLSAETGDFRHSPAVPVRTAAALPEIKYRVRCTAICRTGRWQPEGRVRLGRQGAHPLGIRQNREGQYMSARLSSDPVAPTP